MKTILSFLNFGRQHVDMIVRVIAHGMPGRGDLLEPTHVRLFQHAAHTEEMNLAPVLFCDASCLGGITLRWFVEISLLIVPFCHSAARIMAAHLQVERDGNLSGLLAQRRFPCLGAWKR